METVLTNAYTRLDQKSKLFKTNSIAFGTKELLHKWNEWRLRNDMEIKLWELSACIK